ncbi:hypothetical protein ABZ835_48080 [Streptomyces sp. NPDC047461]|uniref:hypothetical protein n=1 Tax=Streptomyces sp. NPDC047461 TaxID=3155619 RepID=UPI00340D0EB9
MTNEQPETPTTPTLPNTPPPPTEPPAVPPAPARRPLRPITAGLIGLAAGAALVGSIWAITATSGSTPDTFTMEGNFALTEKAASDGDGGCEGSYDSGYDDISEGTSVTVYGAAGDVIATGELGNSELHGSGCIFDIAIDDVPKGEKFYKVEVAHRGTLQLTAEEAENGELTATLG